jgi:hypothetical protein
MASAWAAFVTYLVMMIISYFYGQKYMPVKYDFKTIGIYTGAALALYLISIYVQTPYAALNMIIKTILLITFLGLLIKRDFPLKSIPFINRFIRK